MNIIQRATNILTRPKEEWQRIDAEPATPASLFGGYAVILAALAAIGSLIGLLIVMFVLASIVAGFTGGMGGMMFGAAAYGVGGSVVNAVLMFVLGLVVVYGMGMIASALAPSFGGVRNDIAGLKTTVYASTAVWVGGMISIVPILGGLVALVLLGYAIYLFYLGSIIVQKVPRDKAVLFTVVIALIWLLISWIASFIVSAIVGTLFRAATLPLGGY